MQINPNVVGIVGIGRMGSAIAERLQKTSLLLLADRVSNRAKYWSTKVGGKKCKLAELFQKSSVVLLLVPANEIRCLVSKYASFARPGTIIVNMATDISTTLLQKTGNRNDLEWVAAKIVGQANALRQGLDPAIVVSGSSSLCRQTVLDLLKPIGTVIEENEDIVPYINEIATRQALKCTLELCERVRSKSDDERLLRAATKLVAVGTIIEYFSKNQRSPFLRKLLNTMVE